MDDNKSKELSPSWKGSIIFGLINIFLVILCTQIRIVLFSNAMILLLICGICVTFEFIKTDWREGFKASAIGCVIGLIFHCVASILYVTRILGALIAPFLRLL